MSAAVGRSGSCATRKQRVYNRQPDRQLHTVGQQTGFALTHFPCVASSDSTGLPAAALSINDTAGRGGAGLEMVSKHESSAEGSEGKGREGGGGVSGHV